MKRLDLTHYRKKYGEPANETEAITILSEAYSELIETVTMSTKEGIAEQYRILTARGLDGFEWLLDAFTMVSRKEKDKRTLPYIIGMLRQWMKHGYGHIPSQEEEDLVDFLEEESGIPISYEARKKLKVLMGNYGSIKIARMIPKVKSENDMSLLFVSLLDSVLEQKFHPALEEVAASKE